MVSKVYMICDAYESGVGHGLQGDGHDNSKGNLFGDNKDLNEAYCIGYKLGDERRKRKEPVMLTKDIFKTVN